MEGETWKSKEHLKCDQFHSWQIKYEWKWQLNTGSWLTAEQHSWVTEKPGPGVEQKKLSFFVVT